MKKKHQIVRKHIDPFTLKPVNFVIRDTSQDTLMSNWKKFDIFLIGLRRRLSVADLVLTQITESFEMDLDRSIYE